MKILGVTLARGGSKGVPGKNIRKIQDKPMLLWTTEEAAKSTLLKHYVVSSDDPEIRQVAVENGTEALVRPDELAQDDTPSIDALIHALDTMEVVNKVSYDAVADIRCTNPLKTVEDIDGAIDKFIRARADIVCGVTKLEDHHPARIKRVFMGRLIDFSYPEPEGGNRQDLKPDAYIRNGSIYVVRTAALREGIHFQGTDQIFPWIMPLERSVNVDSELDFMVCSALLARREGKPYVDSR